jgi:hypothetical protein
MSAAMALVVPAMWEDALLAGLDLAMVLAWLESA